MRSDAERDVLHAVAAHIFPILLGRDPYRVLKQSYGLVVAATTHRVEDDDVRHASIGLHHEAQAYCALDLTLLGLGRELHVVDDILPHIAAIGEIGLGHFFQLLIVIDFIGGVGFQR